MHSAVAPIQDSTFIVICPGSVTRHTIVTSVCRHDSIAVTETGSLLMSVFANACILETTYHIQPVDATSKTTISDGAVPSQSSLNDNRIGKHLQETAVPIIRQKDSEAIVRSAIFDRHLNGTCRA